jgi:hypothetical protein
MLGAVLLVIAGLVCLLVNQIRNCKVDIVNIILCWGTMMGYIGMLVLGYIAGKG